jgi:hypothetical protein
MPPAHFVLGIYDRTAILLFMITSQLGWQTHIVIPSFHRDGAS